MRTVLFIALGTLAAFLTGLAGTYFVLPMVAPEAVETQRMRADSLARLDSLTQGFAVDLADDLAQASSAPGADSLFAADTSFRALGTARSDSSVAPQHSAALQDSLLALQRILANYEARIRAFEAEIGAANTQRAQAGDLASTLIKLEDRELARVLSNLDLDVLEILYAESSARNRARLLGALDPARTAVFIRRATSSGSVPSPAPSPSPDLANEAESAEPEADASTPR